MEETAISLKPIGLVRSELIDLKSAPMQGDEGAPAAWLDLDPQVAQGLVGISVGDELILLTWLHQAHRDVLKVHPRGNPAHPLTGVFATRSPHRPNPIGLHRVKVLEIQKRRIKVKPLEAIDGTPVIDIKTVLSEADDA